MVPRQFITTITVMPFVAIALKIPLNQETEPKSRTYNVCFTRQLQYMRRNGRASRNPGDAGRFYPLWALATPIVMIVLPFGYLLPLSDPFLLTRRMLGDQLKELLHMEGLFKKVIDPCRQRLAC